MVERLTCETVEPSALVGWDSEDLTVSREFGDTWLREMRTAVLQVASVTTEGRENNVLINPLHPQFSKISVSEPEPIHWDSRLFGSVQRK